MPLAIVGRRYLVNGARCHVSNKCAECGAALPMGLSVKVALIRAENFYRNRIDAHCDACGVRKKIDAEPMEEF